MKISIRLTAALLLAAVCTLTSAARVITCDDGKSVQRLSCDTGVILVTQALYGRTNKQTCSQGRPRWQLTNTSCSQDGTLDVLANSCNGKTSCEVDPAILHTPDPCPGTFKYIDTTYTCVPETRVQICIHASAELACGKGHVISITSAAYGYLGRTSCPYPPPFTGIHNIFCINPDVTYSVAQICNGKTLCHVVSYIADQCVGNFRYLEVAYTCKSS